MKNSGIRYAPRLSARGRLTLTAGAGFNGTISQSGMQGALGIGITLDGTESTLKIEGSDLLVSSSVPNGGTYTSGDFSVTSGAAKVAVELLQSTLLEAGKAVQIVLTGAESRIALQGLNSQTISQRIAIRASGFKGEARAENGLLQATPDAIVESGPGSSTQVTHSPGRLSATERIVVHTGTNGSCSASTQGLAAPVLQICR